jgi:trimeric autotransporter adhesin
MILAASSGGCQLILPIQEDAGASIHEAGVPHEDAGSCAPKESYENEVMMDKPSLYLRLDEDGGPVAHNLADGGYSYNGEYPDSGVTYGVKGAIATEDATAVEFNGTTGITMPPGLDFSGTAPFSVELWANTTMTTSWGFAIDHNDYQPTVASRGGWDVILGQSAALERYYDDTTGGSVAAAKHPWTGSAFHHVVTTFDGTDLVVYIDAVQKGGPNGVNPNIPNTGAPWKIAHQNCTGCNDNAYIGALDEVAVYPTALSPCRILAHYRAATGN